MREATDRPDDDLEEDTIKGCYFFELFGIKIAMWCEPGSEKFWTALGVELGRRVKDSAIPLADDCRHVELNRLTAVALVALDALAELQEANKRIANLQIDLPPRVH